MCGISVIQSRNDRPSDVSDVRRMCSSIRHRGPDDAGFALLDKGRVAMGHVRLSIIDLDTGAQPMFNENGTIGISFNGEIYDYQQHRKHLKTKGHVFSSESDTEVILHLYEEYGAGCFSMLNGEFALVLFDENTRTLIAARDIAGIKPLFYHESSSELILASECKAILCLDRIPRAIAPEYLSGAFVGVLPPASSAFQGIRSLKPGHFLISKPGARSVEHPYWTHPYETDTSLSFQDARDEVGHLVTEAVKRRMVADVPVGAYLSGGLDSTLICSVMARHHDRFTAFNVGFGKSVFDETDEARKNAEKIGIPLSSIQLSMDQMAREFAETIYHTEFAIIDPHAMAKQMLSRHVRACGHKVCITGEGADEVFAGYPYFKMEQILLMIGKGGKEAAEGRRLWKKFLRHEKRSERILWDRRKTFLEKSPMLGYASYTFARAKEMTLGFSELMNPKILQDQPAAHFPSHFSRCYPVAALNRLHPINASRQMSFHQLSSYVLPILGDRVEMANSVECRTPFLDKALIQFAATLPPEYLIHMETLREKHILKEAFIGSLPSSMQQARKHPFLTPGWTEFFKTEHGKIHETELLSTIRLSGAGIFLPDKILRMRKAIRLLPQSSRLKKRLCMTMGYLLSLQMLHHLFVEKRVISNPLFPMADRTPGVSGLRVA